MFHKSVEILLLVKSGVTCFLLKVAAVGLGC